MSLQFSPLQQRCLDALGYTVYALAGEETASKPVPARIESAANAPGDASAPSTRPAQPSSATRIASSVAAVLANPRDRRLLAAVLKASRVQIDTIEDPQRWLAARGVASIALLRPDPAAKRALWIQLRRERRAP